MCLCINIFVILNFVQKCLKFDFQAEVTTQQDTSETKGSAVNDVTHSPVDQKRGTAQTARIGHGFFSAIRSSSPMIVEILTVFVISGLTVIATLFVVFICGCLCKLNVTGSNASGKDGQSTTDMAVGTADEEISMSTISTSTSTTPSTTVVPPARPEEVRFENEVQKRAPIRPRAKATSSRGNQRATFYTVAASSSTESVCFTGDQNRLSGEINKTAEKIHQLQVREAQLVAIKGRWDKEIFV